MMSAKKNSNPILREVLVTSLQMVLGLLGGVLICAAWLVWKPVTVMDSPPKAERELTDRHEVIYVRGRPASRGAQSARKHKAFLARTPGELVFIEEDVNRWFVGTFGSKELTFPIKGTGVTMMPRIPAARLLGDELELGLEIAFERGEQMKTFVVQTRGAFVDRGGSPVFVPREIYLGSCPLPWNLGGRFLYQQLAKLYPVPGNADVAWDAVSSAQVADKRLRLTIGPAAAATPEVATPAAPESVVAPAPMVAQPAPAGTPAVASTLPAAMIEPPPAANEAPPAAPPEQPSLPQAEPAGSEPVADSSTQTAEAPAPTPTPAPAEAAPASPATEGPAPSAAPESEPAGTAPGRDSEAEVSAQEETAPAAPTP